MVVRADYQALLTVFDRMALNVSEAAVAFENSGRSINAFPLTLHYARRQRLIRAEFDGRIKLTARGRKVLARFRA